MGVILEMEVSDKSGLQPDSIAYCTCTQQTLNTVPCTPYTAHNIANNKHAHSKNWPLYKYNIHCTHSKHYRMQIHHTLHHNVWWCRLHIKYCYCKCIYICIGLHYSAQIHWHTVHTKMNAALYSIAILAITETIDAWLHLCLLVEE